jgi:putative glycosyltransferase (TIGR04372 family)
MNKKDLREIFLSIKNTVFKKPLSVKKFLNFVTLLIVTVPSFIFCFLQRITSPFVTIRIGKIRNQHYGHFLLESDYYLSKNANIKNSPYKLDIFYLDGESANRFYQEVLRKQIYILPKCILQMIYFLNFHLFKSNKFTIIIPDRITDLTELDKYNPGINLLPVNINTVTHLNYDFQKSCVLFFLRDSEKFNDSFSLRNVDVRTYDKSVDLLISMNFDVYVFTDKYITHYSEKMVKKISRNSSDLATASLEFYLASICDFAVATDSGSFHLPYLFRKKIILTNICGPIGDIKSSFIHGKTYKKWVDLNLGFELDFTIFKTEVLFDSDHLFKEHNIGLIDNTEEEIRDAIELFLKNRKP